MIEITVSTFLILTFTMASCAIVTALLLVSYHSQSVLNNSRVVEDSNALLRNRIKSSQSVSATPSKLILDSGTYTIENSELLYNGSVVYKLYGDSSFTFDNNMIYVSLRSGINTVSDFKVCMEAYYLYRFSANTPQTPVITGVESSDTYTITITVNYGTIYYTLDYGVTWNAYTGSFTVNKGGQVQAVAENGTYQSGTATYQLQ
jgi:hypothetical protein